MGSVELTIIMLVCGTFLVVVLVLASAIRVVPENQRLSVFRLGRYIGEVGPGVVFLLPIIDRAVKKDVQDQVKKLQDEQAIWAAVGQTMTTVHTAGEVEVAGEVWNATSQEPIPPGTAVRVTKIVLEVERL
jgi:regulator of protease activity HflC (stomatin/prohibitin superfamily)